MVTLRPVEPALRYYDQNRITTEKQAAAVTGHYTYGVTRLSRDDGTDFLYYQADGLGSARQLTDETEAVVNSYLFEGFGSLVTQTGSAENPYQYAGSWGYRDDGDAGLIHVGARYYDPEVGRFTSADPEFGDIYLPQTLNRYVYVNNNPVNLLDPSGRGLGLAGLFLIVVILVVLLVLLYYIFFTDELDNLKRRLGMYLPVFEEREQRFVLEELRPV